MIPATSLPPDVNGAVAVASLSVAFATKHYLADFLLQTNWMARGKEARTAWVGPLLAHVAVHAAFALAILLAAAPRLWWLAAVDAGVHTGVDRGKALVTQHYPCGVDQPRFWWLLGADQYIHQLTNIGLAAAVVVL